MKKKNIFLEITLILFVISIISVSIKALKKDNKEAKLNNMAFINTNSSKENEIQKFKELLKENYGDNYKEKIDKNISATEKAKIIESNFKMDNSQKIIYPDNYGGTYINENNDLVIQIVKNKKTQNFLNYDSSKEVINLDNEIVKEYVDYSYSDLIHVNDIITNYFLNHGVKNDNFVANYIDVFKNRVVVELRNISLLEQHEFKKEVIDSDLIEFRTGERISTTATYKAGSKYSYDVEFKKGGTTVNNIDSHCSVGARSKLNGTIGYITAGHCFGYMDYTVVSSSIENGIFVKRNYSSSMDAAFVKLKSGNTLSNDLSDKGYQASFINTTGQNYFTNGTMVGKDGYAGKYGFGVVGSLNYSVTDEDEYYHTNLVQANITGAKGDSGGPVFTISTLTSGSGAPLIGIISVGGPNILGFYEYNKIVTTLGLTKY